VGHIVLLITGVSLLYNEKFVRISAIDPELNGGKGIIRDSIS
jgi:hypothetical protein